MSGFSPQIQALRRGSSLIARQFPLSQLGTPMAACSAILCCLSKNNGINFPMGFSPSADGFSKTWVVFYFPPAFNSDPALLKVLQEKLPSGSADAWKTSGLGRLGLIKLFAAEEWD